jgi:hypothetical protein
MTNREPHTHDHGPADHEHGHGHAHGAAHPHHHPAAAPAQPPAATTSLLMRSALARLAGAAALIALLWTAVAWSLSGTP